MNSAADKHLRRCDLYLLPAGDGLNHERQVRIDKPAAY